MKSVVALAMCGLLIGSFAMAGCGDDGDSAAGGGGAGGQGGSTSSGDGGAGGPGEGGGGNPGEGGGGNPGEGGGGSGSVGEGGTGVGGTGGEGGTTAAAGGGGAGGEGGSGPPESCSGCARLSVPFTAEAEGTSQQFLIELDDLTDMTGATVTLRVMTYAGTNGGVQPFVENGEAHEWASVGWGWNAFSDMKDKWTDITLDVDTLAAESETFDKTEVMFIGLQMTAGDTGPWTNPTVVYVDSVTVTRSASTSGAGGGGGGAGGAEGTGGAGGADGTGGSGDADPAVIHIVGPFEFTTSEEPFALGSYNPIDGSEVTHIAE